MDLSVSICNFVFQYAAVFDDGFVVIGEGMTLGHEVAIGLFVARFDHDTLNEGLVFAAFIKDHPNVANRYGDSLGFARFYAAKGEVHLPSDQRENKKKKVEGRKNDRDKEYQKACGLGISARGDCHENDPDHKDRTNKDHDERDKCGEV